MGPGTGTQARVALGHRRLAVVDPAGGAQPMVRQRAGAAYVLTCNGELFNTFDLRRELEGKGWSVPMGGAQLFAYLVQVDAWFREYEVAVK